MLQDIKCQFKRGNTVPAGTGRLEIVCSIAPEGQQFIVFSPVQLIDIQTESRRSGEVKFPFTQMRENDSRKSQRGRKSHFPTVHQRALLSASGLPFVRSFQFDIPAFATSEYIITGDTKRSTGASLVITLRYHVQFQFCIQRFGKRSLHSDIQRITSGCRISGSILHIKIAEYTQLAQFLLNLFLTVLAIKASTVGSSHLFAPHKLLIIHPPIKHIRTNPQLIIIVDIQILIQDTVVRSFSILSEKIYRSVSHIISTLGSSRQTRNRNQAKADMTAGH